MSQAIEVHSTASMPAPVVIGADTDILRLAGLFQESDRIMGELIGQVADGASGRLETILLLRRKQTLARKIAGLIATTPEGLRAKAAVLMGMSPIGFDPEESSGSTCELLGASLARDILGPFSGAEARR